MTNYNNGEWWGWNGGECPVHPKTVVDTRWETPRPLDREPAGDFDNSCWRWGFLTNRIVAFRVIKQYKEPREFWVFLGKTYHDAEGAKQAYRNACRQSPHHSGKEIIHVREVLE